MADIMGDYGQLKAKAKADAGYRSFPGHEQLKPPPDMTPEQEARWRRAVEGRVEGLSEAKAEEDAAQSKQRAKIAGQIAAETAVGFTPAGIVIDVKDLVSAISDRDALMLAMSMLAFVPGLDVIKSVAKARHALEAVPKRKLVKVIEQNPERLSQETRSVIFEGAPKPKKTKPFTDVEAAEATKAADDIRAGRRVSPERTRKAEALETDEARLLQEDEAFREAMARESAPSMTTQQRRIAEERGESAIPHRQHPENVPPAPAKIVPDPASEAEMARQSALLRDLKPEPPTTLPPLRAPQATLPPGASRTPDPSIPGTPTVTTKYGFGRFGVHRDIAEPLPMPLRSGELGPLPKGKLREPSRVSLAEDPSGALTQLETPLPASRRIDPPPPKSLDELAEEAAVRERGVDPFGPRKTAEELADEAQEAARARQDAIRSGETPLTRPAERPPSRAAPEPYATMPLPEALVGPGTPARTPKVAARTPTTPWVEEPGLLQTPLSDIKLEQVRRALGGKPRPEGVRVQRRTPEGTSTWEQDGTLYIRDEGERITGLRTSDPRVSTILEELGLPDSPTLPLSPAKSREFAEMAESLDQPNIVPAGGSLADPRARGTLTPEGFVQDPLSLGERASGAARAAGERLQELSPEQRRRVAVGLAAGTGFTGVGAAGLRLMGDADEEEPPQETPAVETPPTPEPAELEPAPPLEMVNQPPPPAKKPKKETKKAAPKKKDAASTTTTKGPPPKPTDWNK